MTDAKISVRLTNSCEREKPAFSIFMKCIVTSSIPALDLSKESRKLLPRAYLIGYMLLIKGKTKPVKSPRTICVLPMFTGI